MTKSGYKKYLWILIAVSVFVLDRSSKDLALNHLVLEEPINILPILNLFLTYNTGAAFSFLGKASGWQEWLFIGIAISVSIFIIIWLIRLKHTQALLRTSLALILGGSLGNLYDRIMYHKVIDFIDFFYKDWHYPIFNIADSAICIGAFLLLLDLLFKEKKEREEKKLEENKKRQPFFLSIFKKNKEIKSNNP